MKEHVGVEIDEFICLFTVLQLILNCELLLQMFQSLNITIHILILIYSNLLLHFYIYLLLHIVYV